MYIQITIISKHYQNNHRSYITTYGDGAIYTYVHVKETGIPSTTSYRVFTQQFHRECNNGYLRYQCNSDTNSITKVINM